jgi:hypothetical protein
MKKILFRLAGIGLTFWAFCLYGCAALLIGGGVAGGIAISKDTAQLEIDSSFEHAWDVIYSTVDDMGLIGLRDKKAGRIEADVQNSKVIVQLKRITAKAVRIKVSARKNLFPNIDLAIDIINRIHDKL